jgi:sarcosine oxidase
MGSAAAWQLAKRGARVVLLERFEPGHVRGASHGASRMFRFAYPDPFYVDLVARALPLWREVEAASGQALLAITGGVDHGDPASLQAIANALDAVGVTGNWLEPDEATRRWPGLRFDASALHHPDSGRLDADAAVSALQRQAAGHGAQVLHHARATRVDEDGVRVGDDVFQAPRIVVTAGAWTRHLLGEHLPLPPLHVTQEQPLHFAAAGDTTGAPTSHRSSSPTGCGRRARASRSASTTPVPSAIPTPATSCRNRTAWPRCSTTFARGCRASTSRTGRRSAAPIRPPTTRTS